MTPIPTNNASVAEPAANLPASRDAAKKTWTAGTLTYTSSGLIVLFAWLLMGDFAWSMRDRSIGPTSSWYLNHLGVPNLLFGLLISTFPAFMGLILGPVISVKSDRYRSKWGRRIPFLLVTTPLAGFGMIGLAVTPFIARWVHGFFPNESEMVVSVICFGLFWAAFEAATVASGAVFGGLINDVVPKQLIGRFYGMFRAVSLIDGMIFNFWLTGKIPEHFTLIMGGVGIFYGAAFTWVCFKVKEGSYPPLPPADPARQGWRKGFWDGLKMYYRECFSKPYYLSIFVMLMAAVVAFVPINVFSIPYARSLGLSMDVYGKYLALTYLISLCLSYFIGWLADYFHPLRMVIVTMSGYLIVAIWGSCYATTSQTFLIAWVLHGVLSGCYYTSSASLTARLFPQSKFAQFYAAASIVAAPAQMSVAPLMGIIIDRAGDIYRYTFVAGCVLAVLSLVSACYVHGQFMRLGGPKNYVAPV
ncbi:MAG TPA: MFS transporter [Rariglobus sp.]|nr:MFS transporter [Rariglobus sp.]